MFHRPPLTHTHIGADSHEYVGDFLEGAIHGRGKLKSKDGSTYEGEVGYDVYSSLYSLIKNTYLLNDLV